MGNMQDTKSIPYGSKIGNISPELLQDTTNIVFYYVVDINCVNLIMKYWDDTGILVENNCQCGLPMFHDKRECLICRVKGDYADKYDTYIERCAFRLLYFLYITKSYISEDTYITSEKQTIKIFCYDKNGNKVEAKYQSWYGKSLVTDCTLILSFIEYHDGMSELGYKYIKRIKKWLKLPYDEFDSWNREEATFFDESFAIISHNLQLRFDRITHKMTSRVICHRIVSRDETLPLTSFEVEYTPQHATQPECKGILALPYYRYPPLHHNSQRDSDIKYLTPIPKSYMISCIPIPSEINVYTSRV